MKRPVILISILSLLAAALYSLLLESGMNSYLYTSIAKTLLFLVAPLIYFAFTKDKSIISLFSFKGNKKYMKVFAFTGIAVFLLIIISYLFLSFAIDRATVLSGLLSEGITKTTYPFVFLHIVLINALLEELFFRGFVFLTLLRHNCKLYAYIFSSALFAVYHITMINGWFNIGIFAVCMGGLVAAGLIFAEADRRCENIYGSLFIHFSANMAINIIGAYMMYF